MKFYSNKRLLYKKDLNGEEPAILICTGVRGDGKTTCWNRWLIDRAINHGELFLSLVRLQDEMLNFNHGFFENLDSTIKIDNMQPLEGYKCYQQVVVPKKIYSLFLETPEGEIIKIGYVSCLKANETIKRNSNLFNEVKYIVLDEFQNEKNQYLKNEEELLTSIYVSVNRGQGTHDRGVKLILIGNMITLLNPYYVKLKIHERLRMNTHFLRGDGWVLEQSNNQEAREAMESNKVLKAFENRYTRSQTEFKYLLDTYDDVKKENLKNTRYICTIRVNDKTYGIRLHLRKMVYLVTRTTDLDYGLIYINSKEPARECELNDMSRVRLYRDMFQAGLFRFDSLESKSALIEYLRY